MYRWGPDVNLVTITHKYTNTTPMAEVTLLLTEEDIERIAQRTASIILSIAPKEEQKEKYKIMTFKEIAKELKCVPATVGRKIKERCLDNEVVQMGRQKGINSKYINELLKAS